MFNIVFFFFFKVVYSNIIIFIMLRSFFYVLMGWTSLGRVGYFVMSGVYHVCSISPGLVSADFEWWATVCHQY